MLKTYNSYFVVKIYKPKRANSEFTFTTVKIKRKYTRIAAIYKQSLWEFWFVKAIYAKITQFTESLITTSEFRFVNFKLIAKLPSNYKLQSASSISEALQAIYVLVVKIYEF